LILSVCLYTFRFSVGKIGGEMIWPLLVLLQIELQNPDSLRAIRDLNFDPEENLGLPAGSVDLKNINPLECLRARTVYPIAATIPLIRGLGQHPQTIKIQECFIADSTFEKKLVIVAYYDTRRNIRAPIAFVYAVARSDTARAGGGFVYNEIWGLADEGFIQNGKINRSWRTLRPEPRRTIRDQLTDLLRPGFERAKNPRE